MATLTLRPNAAGDETNLTPIPGSGEANWQDVDEVTSDEDTTYVKVNNTSKRDLYGLPDHTTEGGVINFVKATARCRLTVNTGSVRPAVKTEGTVYEGTEQSLTASHVNYSHQWDTNPNTGIAWTWSQIDALQAGIWLKHTGTTGRSQCTQVYI